LEDKKLRPWDFVDSILKKEYIPVEYHNQISKYIVNRYFASNISFTILTKYMNKNYPYLTNTMFYDFWYNIIPKSGKKIFYPKFAEKKNKYIKEVAEFFKISFEEAEMYLKNLTKEEIKFIIKENKKKEIQNKRE